MSQGSLPDNDTRISDPVSSFILNSLHLGCSDPLEEIRDLEIRDFYVVRRRGLLRHVIMPGGWGVPWCHSMVPLPPRSETFRRLNIDVLIISEDGG